MNPAADAKLHLLDYWRVIRIRLGLIILIFLLTVVTVGVTTFLLPKEYMSYATIEITADMMPVRVFSNSPAEEVNDPKFTSTQFEDIKRKGVLYPVINQLRLANRWAVQGQPLSTEATFRKLQGMMQLQEVRNTNLIQISVFSTDRQEAALIANTIAEEYMTQRVSEQQTKVSSGLDNLRQEVKKQEDAVSAAYAEASRLRTEAGVNDPNPDSIETASRVEDSSVLSNQEKVNDAQSQIATLKSRVEQLDRLKNEDLMRVAGLLNLNDPILQQKLPIYQTAVADKARMLSSGLGRNHPDVRAIQAQIDTIEKQLRQQIDSIRRGLVTQLTISEDTLKSLQSNLNTSQSEQQEKKTASAAYLEAKSKYLLNKRLLEAAKTSLNSKTLEQTMPQRPAMIRDPAEPASFPSRPRVTLNLFLGVIAGVVLGVGFAFFLEYLDTSVKTMEDVEKLLDLPVLAIIPKGIKLLVNEAEDTPDAEAYRILRTNVEFARQKAGVSVINFVSGGASEGKSTTVCNLATTFAASGRRTLVIDGDLRRPSQHVLLDLDNRIGLSDYLREERSLDDVIQPGPVSNLFVITSGEAAARTVGLLNSENMENLIKTAGEWFDLVLIDCPPLLGVSDASILSRFAQASIIVAQHRKFPRSMLLRVKNTLQNIGSRTIGVVLNNVDVRHDSNYEYYTSYNKYYSASGKTPRSTGPAGPRTKIGTADAAKTRSNDDVY